MAKNKGGRPTKKTKELTGKLEEAFKNDSTVSAACRYAGIDTATYYDWYNSDSEFSSAMDRAKDFFLEVARKSVLKAMPDDANLALKVLERRNKKRYSPRQELTGSEGGPVGVINVMPDVV